MERFNPKIEIINHFDNLINKIDIDIDSYIERFNDQQLLSEILKISEYYGWFFRNFSNNIKVEFFDKIDSFKPNPDSWPESMKVVDYLKQVRMKTIVELKKAQVETLEYYKLSSERFKYDKTNEKNIEEMKSELFSEKFYFQVNFKHSENRFWPFNVFTFVTDFYLTQSYIDLLELEYFLLQLLLLILLLHNEHISKRKLINNEKEPFGRDCIFDDKIVLTGLLFKCFIKNLLNFPNHVIHVRKQDVLNIQSIKFYDEYSGINLTSSSTIDLSKLVDLSLFYLIDTNRSEWVKFKIDGLSSLKTLYFRADTLEVDFSIKNLPSLTKLYLYIYGRIDEKIVTRLLDKVPHIQELYLGGNLCYFNLDSLLNLRDLSLFGVTEKNFNFELFKNLCNQLESIKITNFVDEKSLLKLFDGYNFPYLADFTLMSFSLKRLKKEFMNGFSTLTQLNITECAIEVIDHDSFSNLQQLTSLNLSKNRIGLIEKNTFSNLNNLQTLDLSDNKLTKFDRSFIGLGNSVEVKIENNIFNS